MNSITCWNVERLVHRIVNGISPGMKLIRCAGEDHSCGLDPSLAASFNAAAWIAAHSDRRHAARLPLPQ